MFCSNCGGSLASTQRFCSSCGTPTTSAGAGGTSAAKPSETSSLTKPTTKFWTPQKIALTIVGGIIGLIISVIIRSGANPLNGEVALDVNVIETTIHDGVLEQSGEEVSVECPSTMAGKPGETRNCVVTDSTGAVYFVVVTFESSKGDISWKLDPQQ